MDDYSEINEENPTDESGNVVVEIFENYGWFFFLVAIAAFYLYNKFKYRIDDYWKRKEDQEYAAKYHKDPELTAQRLQAQESRILHLQEQYNKDAEIHKAKLAEKEAKKRSEWLDRHTSGGSKEAEGYPLMGDSTKFYRPARKSPCGSGGCQ